MRSTAGLNFSEKNHIRRHREAGLSVEAIAANVNADPGLVARYLFTIEQKQQAKGAPAKMPDLHERELQKKLEAAKAQQAEPVDAPAAIDSDRDEFGPLPASAEWEELRPTEKAQLTRRRNLKAMGT